MAIDTGAVPTLRTSARSDDVSDELLVYAARRGDEQAAAQLLLRYRSMVRAAARWYFLAGSDRDDVEQEGYIGLYKAMCRFDVTAEVPFRAYARMCVAHHIQTAVAAASRRKHLPLNHAVPLVNDDGSEGGALEPQDTVERDPMELVLSREEHGELTRFLVAALTPLEQDVLARFLDGSSYDGIATTLSRSRKAVDNALQRIRRKVTYGYLANAA